MRILVDSRTLIWKGTGAHRYLHNLLTNLAKIDKENEYFVFVRHKEEFDKNEFRKVVFKSPRGHIFNPIWTNISLPLALKRNRIDVLHSPHTALPFIKMCPSVLTVHDLSFEVCPWDFRIKSRLFLRATSRLVCLSADKIIVPSTRIKKDLTRIYKISEDKIEVIYEAADEIFRPINREKASEEVERKYKIKDDFILHVGLLRPRRNILTLLKAFNKLRSEYDVKVKLVLVGPAGYKSDELFNFVAKHDLNEEVIQLDYVPDKDLLYMYNAAEMFVYPSLYEGFGLPMMEAMACGTPMLASNIQPMLEIVGNGGLFFDPHNVTEMSQKMYSVLTDDNLKLKLKEKALARTRDFSWEVNAKRTQKIYYELYLSQ